MSNLMENCSICNISNPVLIKISSVDRNQVKWSRKLNLCVPAVDWGDDCSICPNCIGQLENAYNFFQLCLQSYEVRKQQAAFTVELEPCYEPQENVDVMVTNPIKDEVQSRVNICVPTEVDTGRENESINVDKTEVKFEDCSENEEEDECEDDSYIPPDLNESTSLAVSGQLPNKSKERYDKTFTNFENWRKLKNIKSITEDLLLTYFAELGKCYKPSSLWTTHSMLKSMLLLKKNLDISSYNKLLLYLRKNSVGYQVKKSKVFSPSEINKFLKEADDKYLATKIALIMGIMGACRANEMYSMRIDDLQDLGTAYLVTVPNAKSKGSRKFMVTDMFYHICKKYVALRPSHATSNIFFLNYQNGKCTIQRIGINKFTTMGRQIATFLNLPNPEQYSGHSFRISSATLLVDAGGLLMM